MDFQGDSLKNRHSFAGFVFSKCLKIYSYIAVKRYFSIEYRIVKLEKERENDDATAIEENSPKIYSIPHFFSGWS